MTTFHWKIVEISTGDVIAQFEEKPAVLGGPWQWGLESGEYEWREVEAEE